MLLLIHWGTPLSHSVTTILLTTHLTITYWETVIMVFNMVRSQLLHLLGSATCACRVVHEHQCVRWDNHVRIGLLRRDRSVPEGIRVDWGWLGDDHGICWGCLEGYVTSMNDISRRGVLAVAYCAISVITNSLVSFILAVHNVGSLSNQTAYVWSLPSYTHGGRGW